MILRSTVNACRMLNQKSSSRATRSAGRPDTAAPADWARATASLWKAARTLAAEEKKRRRCIEQANRVSVQNSNLNRDSNGAVLQVIAYSAARPRHYWRGSECLTECMLESSDMKMLV